MKFNFPYRFTALALSLVFLPFTAQTQNIPAPKPSSNPAKNFTLVVHGGAGVITRQNLTPEKEKEFREGIDAALKAGYAVLDKGGSSMDAVVAAIKVMEDNPIFNAGKGAVFTNEGKNELDASIMDGKSGLAGAVAGVTTIKNPITAARAVMEKTKHVLLIGKGAEKFATEQGLEIVDPRYFHTDWRWEQLQRAKEKQKVELDHGSKTSDKKSQLTVNHEMQNGVPFWKSDYKYGTVGAVALDQHGNIVAGTSTGGMTNKMYGRVGDAPIIGAGTFADNHTVGISGTGTGEFYIRGSVAYDIHARMKYAKKNVYDAVDATIKDALDAKEGDGGIIALDNKGNIKFGMNTEGMYRGYVRGDGATHVYIFK